MLPKMAQGFFFAVALQVFMKTDCKLVGISSIKRYTYKHSIFTVLQLTALITFCHTHKFISNIDY